MTPKIIELKQAPVVLVELPVGEIVFFNIDPLVRSEIESRGFTYHGRLLHLTEEQFAEYIENEKTFDYNRHLWNYIEKEYQPIRPDESFYSLLESEKVYMENPYGIERPPNTPIDSIPYTENKGYVHFRNQHPNVPPNDSSLSYESFILKWHEAQSRTIDPKRTVVLLRK